MALITAPVLCGCAPGPDSLRVSGQIEGHPIAVGSRVGGRVSEVLAGERFLAAARNDKLDGVLRQTLLASLRASN